MTKPAPTNSDASRFRSFAKLVVNTPKAVVDQRAKEYIEARKRAKTAR